MSDLINKTKIVRGSIVLIKDDGLHGTYSEGIVVDAMGSTLKIRRKMFGFISYTRWYDVKSGRIKWKGDPA